MGLRSVPRRARRRARPTATWLAAALGLAACGEPAPEPPSWPEGTVFVLDEHPILAEEVDEVVVPVAVVLSGKALVHQRRVAFTNVVLPRAVAALERPEARTEARAEAERLRAAAVAGELIGPPGPSGAFGELHEGGWLPRELGLVLFGAALALPPGEWSPVLEEVGCFVTFRVLERQDGPVPEATRFRLDLLRARYADEASLGAPLEELYERHRLTVVDPEWRPVVPELTLYQLRGHDS